MVQHQEPKVNQEDGKSNTNYISPQPAVSLPKGGGAIRGIGEKFSVNPVTGTGSLTIPIVATPSRSDFYPQLSLNYDSGASNGVFGLGWNLSTPSITRKTDKGLPKYRDFEDSDIFILSGAEDLVPSIIDEQTRNEYKVRFYRPRVEGLFARIERWQHQETNEIHWRSLSKDNITSVYGRSKELNSRIADPENEFRVFKWLLEASYDDKGNVIVYQYKQEDTADVDRSALNEKNRLANNRSYSNVHLKRILYGNRTPYQQAETLPQKDLSQIIREDDWLFQVVFDYGEHDLNSPSPDTEKQTWIHRLDPFSNFRSGFEIRTQRLCQRVLMFHRFDESGEILGTGQNWTLVRSTNFGYEQDPVVTYLTSATQVGYVKQPTTDSYRQRSYPPLELHYDRPELDRTIQSVDSESLTNLPIGMDGTRYQWLDLDSEGISGILTKQANSWLYKRNLGKAHFGSQELVATQPALTDGRNRQTQLMDLAGDGTQDLVVLGTLSGYYQRGHLGEWAQFIPFESTLSIDWDDPNLRFIDLNGDGHADILISEHEVFVWYPSRSRQGFATAERVSKFQDEEKGPTLVFAEVQQSVYLADMTGDGLVDLVRVRNGEICYWPNLGYGHFGAKVTMDNAPNFDHPEIFDPKRIRLADIDGSGPTDIIYLGRDGVRIWFNQAGNQWSDPQILTQFPVIDNLSTVTVVDLFGRGTACLVWSSAAPSYSDRPMHYIDLMGGQKPHLLRKVVNNLGATTKLDYAASTDFYLKARLDGKPWITRLPFPVQVVTQVTTIDHISGNQFTTSYSYRHGYFDGEEREFRGFGYVEQTDTESYRELKEAGASNAKDESLHVHPVITKTWFHTGFFLDRARISQLFAEEYHQGDERLEDTPLANDLTPEEIREACRALKGQMLRQEIYSRDGSDKALHPYTVTESNFTVKKLQPRQNGQFAVFFTHPRESVTYHYERNLQDPRIVHQITLNVDIFGNVLESVTIAYPRRQVAVGVDVGEQNKELITYIDNKVFNQEDPETSWYRVGVPVETKTYEITGLTIEEKLLTIAKLPPFAQVVEIPYEDKPISGVQKRLIEHIQTVYRFNNQANTTDPTPLQLDRVESLALPGESFKLAFTSGLHNKIYANKVNSTELTEGGYIQRDGNWWIPSGRQAFNPQNFYLPTQMKDPFGGVYTTVYDIHSLLAIETRDPLPSPQTNIVSIKNNYRTLQPQQLTEPNGNRSEVAFDALGMVVGTAVMGKVGENRGDTLDGFKADLEETEIQQSLQNPLANLTVLGSATTRLIYDLDAYRRTKQTLPDGKTETGQPIVVYTLARETHTSDLATGEQTKIQHSFLYSDGFGRQLQTKIQAEPGRGISPRWVGTGRTVYNNKGKPIKQYEPFFSATHRYEDELDLVESGVTPIIHYDPLERVIRTDLPNGTFSKVEFDAWQQATSDENDTVEESAWFQERGQSTDEREKRAAALTEKHAKTPTVAHFDVLGRTVLTIADNGSGQKFLTRVEIDIEGNQRSVTDAEGRKVMEYDYDMLGNIIRQRSMEAGDRLMLNNVAGHKIRHWDSRNHQIRTLYDPLQRPTHLFLKRGNETEILVERLIYGESQPESDRNLQGKVYQHYEQAGVVTNERYDFKENLIESSRRLAREYKQIIDWSSLANLTDLRAILRSAEASLEAERFTSFSQFDALNRPIRMVTPHTSAMRPNTIQPRYNEANLLEAIDVWLRRPVFGGQLDPNTADIRAVTNINYNEKGQRTLIEYGNGTRTQYEYDAKTFRLTRLLTLRPRETETQNVQDLRYTYDPIGNITQIQDFSDIQNQIFFRNRRVEPSASYEYDPTYRLIKATGREHLGQTGIRQTDSDDTPRMNLPHPNEGNAMGTYTEEYGYDKVGNILKLVHQSLNGGWTRNYDYRETSLIETDKVSNRLSGTSLPGDAEDVFSARYGYDEHGNMTRMPHLPLMRWDYRDQLQSSSSQNSSTPETTYYVYDASGQRVRKVTERQGQNATRMKERLYFGGFEIYREYNGGGNSVTLERETLHVMDDQQRIMLVESRTLGNDNTPVRSMRYQLGNHLGCACLELDEGADIISYEEYYPYGGTSYQGVRSQTEASKRYRYTGKERDEENGLYYHGARYYAPWLGRWTSCDPKGTIDGINLYQYARNNPIKFIDKLGYDSTKPKKTNLETTVVKPSAHQTFQNLGIPSINEITLNLDQLGKNGRNRPDSFIMHPQFIERPLIPGSSTIIEFKGINLDALTKKQKVVVPIYESKPGGPVEIRTDKLEKFSSELAKGKKLVVNEDNYIRVGIENLEEFQDSVRLWKEYGDQWVANHGERYGIPYNSPSSISGTTNTAQMTSSASAISETTSGKKVAQETVSMISGKKVAKEVTESVGKKALKGVARSLPIVGIAAGIADIAEASQQGRYVRAGLLTVGLVFEPVDWGITLYDTLELALSYSNSPNTSSASK